MSNGSYEEPASYGVDSVITVSKENRWHSLQRQKPQARKPVGVQMRGQTLNRKSHSDVNSVNAAGNRSKSMHNILPPPYEATVGGRPVSVAVPVATPRVPGDTSFLRSVSEDTGTLSRYALSSKSTPNLDKANGFQNGLGSPPNTNKRSVPYDRPFSYVAPESFSLSTNDGDNSVVAPTLNNVIEEAFESSNGSRGDTAEVTVVDAIDVSTSEVTANAPCFKKPAVPPKPRTLSDALQEAVAARTERVSRRPSEMEIDPVQRSRKFSAPESDLTMSIKHSDPSNRRMSSPAMVNPRKKFDTSDVVRSQIMTSLEEQFTEDEINGEKASVENCRNQIKTSVPSKEKQELAVSSTEVDRQYTNFTSTSRDINRQGSLDASKIGHTVITGNKLERQASEPARFDHNQNTVVEARPTNSSLPSPSVPHKTKLSNRDNSSKGAVPPPPPVLSNTSKICTTAAPVAKGLITANDLAAKKGKLKSAPVDHTDGSKVSTPVGKQTAPGSANSRNFGVEHNDLLAKAVAARAARISSQVPLEEPMKQQEKGTGRDIKPASPGKNSKDGLQGRTSTMNFRGKPTPPPVAPKKRLSSPDLRNRRYERTLERGHSFDVPAPILSEEDRSVMMLDEVIRREAESENWSLNSWNSGSDSSSDVFLPPPVWSPEQHDNIDPAASKAASNDCDSPPNESIPKTTSPEKFNKTITTKKGFKIQLTFETKKEPAKQTLTSPATTDNETEPVSVPKPTLIDSTNRCESPPEASVKSKVVSEEKVTVDVKSTPASNDTVANEVWDMNLPPPPLLFASNGEQLAQMDSPPLPPPPEFSPREPNISPVTHSEQEEEAASLPSSARSDDSHKVCMNLA